MLLNAKLYKFPRAKNLCSHTSAHYNVIIQQNQAYEASIIVEKAKQQISRKNVVISFFMSDYVVQICS